MKKQTDKRRLVLEKQTIRALDDKKLAEVGGGELSLSFSISRFFICSTSIFTG